MFLASRCDQECEMVWERDPAIASDGEAVIPLADAELGEGTPDRFIVRALNNREVFSVSAYGNDSQVALALAAVEICALATIRIHQANGQMVKDAEEIRTIMNSAAPPGFVGALASAIYALTMGNADGDKGAQDGSIPLPLASGVTQM